MIAEEFVLWAEGKEGRWELHDGVPVIGAPGCLVVPTPTA